MSCPGRSLANQGEPHSGERHDDDVVAGPRAEQDSAAQWRSVTVPARPQVQLDGVACGGDRGPGERANARLMSRGVIRVGRSDRRAGVSGRGE